MMVFGIDFVFFKLHFELLIILDLKHHNFEFVETQDTMARSLLAVLPFAASISASALYSTYNFNLLHHLGGIAPYFESHDPPTSPDSPQGCTAERAAYLVRHAAIYSNDFDFEAYIEPFVEKLGEQDRH